MRLAELLIPLPTVAELVRYLLLLLPVVKLAPASAEHRPIAQAVI